MRAEADSYTPRALLKALRLIFEQNQDKSFEVRWAIAKESQAYRGFQICCKVSARILLLAIVPLFAFVWVLRQRSPDGGHADLQLSSHHLGNVLVVLSVAAYVALSILVSMTLGSAAARKKLAQERQRDLDLPEDT